MKTIRGHLRYEATSRPCCEENWKNPETRNAHRSSNLLFLAYKPDVYRCSNPQLFISRSWKEEEEKKKESFFFKLLKRTKEQTGNLRESHPPDCYKSIMSVRVFRDGGRSVDFGVSPDGRTVGSRKRLMIKVINERLNKGTLLFLSFFVLVSVAPPAKKNQITVLPVARNI